MVFPEQFEEEPCFVISIAARMVGVHAQTLRYYERVGLIWPSRSVGKQRLYSPADIERLRRIKELTEDLGVNLAGAEIILKLLKRIDELEIKLNNTQETLTNLQNRVIRKPSVNNQKEA